MDFEQTGEAHTPKAKAPFSERGKRGPRLKPWGPQKPRPSDGGREKLPLPAVEEGVEEGAGGEDCEASDRQDAVASLLE